MASLEIRNLSITYGGLRAIDSLSFIAHAGEILGVIGPNGAGKTSLFNAVAGLTSPSSGEILFDSRSIIHLKPFQRAAVGIARTFQNLQIFNDLSVLENVMFGRAPKLKSGLFAGLFRTRANSIEERDIEAAALTQLSRVGLETLAYEPASVLSFGEAKLVELARALMSDPRLLMLDEPTAGVPFSEQERFLGVIRALRDTGTTVVIVEHNMRVVMSLCDQVQVVHHGKHLAYGSPQVVSADQGVITAYLGEEFVDA